MTTAANNQLVRSATAQWQGTLAHGEGWLSTGSQALARARYSFPTRFAQEAGTNPEETDRRRACGLLLDGAGLRAGSGRHAASAHRNHGRADVGDVRRRPELDGHSPVRASAGGGIAADTFAAISQQAKDTCLVSRLLNATVSLEAVLLS